MRIICQKYLSGMLVLLVAFTTQTICIVNAECLTSVTQANPSNSNGCSYPACSSLNLSAEDTGVVTWTCVYDSSFCGSAEYFISASEVLAAGKICSCTDILNYPALIGTCVTDNLYSPMLTADDCEGGVPVCENNGSDKFLTGDTDHPFTACDLKCDVEIGQEIAVPDDTYKGCSFPSFDWTVAANSKFNTLHADQHEIIDDKLYIGGSIESLPTTDTDSAPDDLNHILKGPFNQFYPASGNGVYITDIVTSGSDIIEVIDKDMIKCAIARVDKNTGEPMDLFLLNGKGKCYIESIVTGGRDTGSNGKVIVAGGYHAAGGEITMETTAECIPGGDSSASTSCSLGFTTIKAHEQAFTAFVFLMDPEALSVRWLIQPWLALLDPDYSMRAKKGNDPDILDSYDASVTDSSLDADGDVYISGTRSLQATNPKKYAMISKHSGVDGSLLWEREFLDVRGIRMFHERKELYITFQMERSMIGTAVLGITCNSTSPEICNVIARISSEDGSLEWARYTHGHRQVYERGEIKLAHPDDGPYVYVTYSNGDGTSDLDVGTSYSGCRTDEGNITSEIDPVFSNLKISLNPTACFLKDRGVYFDRTSDYALPAPFANTRAQCRWNRSRQHCLVKYHKLSGLPIWGSVTALIQDFQPVVDGIIMLGSMYGPVTFDTVSLPAPNLNPNPKGDSSIAYQSKIDLNGEGVYVQPIISHQSSATAAGVTQDPDTGDIYIGFLTEASKTHFGPGAPAGFVQDLRLKDMGGDPVGIDASRVVVAKLGVEEVPYCIDSCGGDSGTVIKKGMCFIDQVCYLNQDTGVEIGMPCHICNPSVSQTTWKENTGRFCFIDDICYKDGDYLIVEEIESECQACHSLLDPYAWSVEMDYESNVESDPPYDCAFITLDPTPTVMDNFDNTFAPTPTAYNTFVDDDFTFAPTPTANIDDAYNNAEQDNVGPSIGAKAAIAIGSILLSGAAIATAVYINRRVKKPRRASPRFLQMDVDLA